MNREGAGCAKDPIYLSGYAGLTHAPHHSSSPSPVSGLSSTPEPEPVTLLLERVFLDPNAAIEKTAQV